MSKVLIDYSKIKSFFHMDRAENAAFVACVLYSMMEEEYCYLKEGPEGLCESCDILLSLDDGSELPVHSPVLARCSPVFHGMLAEGTLVKSKVTAESRVIVPFSECSREEATSFLSVIYSLRPHEHLDKTSALSVARLGDKYGVKVHAS